jgi:cytochrome c oxidase cbb3-type subunit III
MRILAGMAICCLALTSCERERRDARPAPVRTIIYDGAARESELQPGGPKQQLTIANPMYGSAYDISEGQRLFQWYNCNGCHANGGGGMGPPLIKQQWIYGGEPPNIFDTIVKGRPNGMPTWGGRIPEYQIWQIVAFVRSLNQEQPKSATPPRLDTLEQKSTNIKNKVPGVTK